jgi:[ribosomal protein S5]-alanine N-acetyltransferase
MKVDLHEGFYIGLPHTGDISDYVRHLNNAYIFQRTLMLPENYSEKDAAWFLHHCHEKQTEFGHPLNFAIRNNAGALIGGCGFHGNNKSKGIAHRDEIGYWLSEENRGKGIMTSAVRFLIRYGFETRRLLRIEAPVYAFNIESQQVLLRCGFTEEGYLRKAYFRNGEYHDAKLYAITR